MPTSPKRKRRVFSVTTELVQKAREAALTAVQIFNNPQITFKSEVFIVLMNIAWTYLLHAHYRKRNVEYRYFDQNPNGRRFHRTSKGAYKYWELERCLNEAQSPIDKDVANNLRFLIGIRHEIEHQMTTRIDSTFSAKFQACCLNFNEYIKKLFGDEFAIDRYLAFSLQFSSISKEQKDTLEDFPNLPAHIKSFVHDFEAGLSDDEFSSPKFAYRVLFVPKTANRKGQADEVIEFVKADSALAQNVNKTYAVIKETERKKFLPKNIVELMQKAGFQRFSIHHHTVYWKGVDAKNPSKGLGVEVEGTWYWYEPWMEQVLTHCKENAAKYS